MILNHNLVLLWCLVGGFIVIQAVSPTPTKNPECPGMKRAASSLEKGIESFTKEPINCQVNNICTGLSCNGTRKTEPFYMKIILQHCMQPPEIHIDLKYPSKNIDVHKELKQNSKIKLYSKRNGLITVYVYLKLTLERHKNHITSSLVLETCTLDNCLVVFTLLPKTTFCVNMNTCKGFNTTGYPPCHATPTPPPKSNPTKSSLATPTGSFKTPTSFPGHSSSTEAKSSLPSTTKTSGSFKTTEPFQYHSSSKPKSNIPWTTKKTETWKTTKQPNSNWTTQSPEPLGDKGHHHGDKHHHMSVGMAVGIGFACIAVIGIIVGVLVYWKKFHHRSRLRAAYYNDISMNDPLYEDFGPEVA